MPLRLDTPLPDLTGATEWVNGEPDFAAFAGNPVLVHFWAVSCHICHENMPTIGKWRDMYSPTGLQVIAIHTPRQPSDSDVERVRQDIDTLEITEPCGIDNTHAVTDAFQNTYVPAYFLFDREGKLRGRSGGNAGLGLLEQSLKRQFEEG